MATHRFRPTRYFNVIGTAEPCLHLADGDTVITDTLDASGLDANEVALAPRGNPMTGPFHIEGAEPGTDVSVNIETFPAVFAGAGVVGGQVIGKSDRLGAYPLSRTFGPPDLAATQIDERRFHRGRRRPHRVHR